MTEKRDGISISDMARIHGVTRQTLIYYDKIGLFKPKKVDEDNGYRYYSWEQVPELREICFLKNAGVPLKETVEHFKNRTAETEIELLRHQKHVLEKEIGRLNRIREAISMRIETYRLATEAERMESHEPFLHMMPDRKVIWKPYIKPISRENLHRTLMELWTTMDTKKSPTGSFGTLIKKDYALSGNFLEGAGSCFFLPIWDRMVKEAIILPGGMYACLFTHHMPYNMDAVKYLLSWIKSQNLELTGDIVDKCLLDTTFYDEENTEDFCLIQAPVKKIEK